MFIYACMFIWHRGVVVIITAQLHLTKPELRFCAGSNPARSVSEICDGEDLWQWSRLEIRLSAFRRSTIPQKQSIIAIKLNLIPMVVILVLVMIKIFLFSMSNEMITFYNSNDVKECKWQIDSCSLKQIPSDYCLIIT